MKHPLSRLPFIALGMAALLSALYGGLSKIGWQLPQFQPLLLPAHPLLMVPGFLGTLISLEIAVAIGKPWGYAAPLCCGTGAILIITGTYNIVPLIFMAIGSVFLTIMLFTIYKKQPSIHLLLMLLGAVSLAAGNLFLILKWPVSKLFLWWVSFILLTIVGERLELLRFKQPSSSNKQILLSGIAVFLIGIVANAWGLGGTQIAGIAMIIISGQLLKIDIAKQTIKQKGVPRFVAFSLLSGYIWLGICGAAMIFFSYNNQFALYDIIIHTFFLGFTFSMIFGHAPIIFPAILNTQINFKNSFYIHLLLLHASLLLRMISDAINWYDGRKIGALLNAAAIILFLINTITSIKKNR